MRRTPPTLGAALTCLVVVGLAACSGSTSPGSRPSSTAPSRSASPRASRALPTSAAAAAAAWAQTSSGWSSYRVTVSAVGSVGPENATRVQTDVDHGKVTSQVLPVESDPTRTPAAPPPDFPRTVDDLLRVAAGDHVTGALFDQTGVPLRIDMDPIANAVDDEFSYVVEVSVPSQQVLLPAVTTLPSPVPTGPAADGPALGARQEAALSADGRRLTLLTWGGSTCWSVPVTASATSPHVVVAETIDFHDGACTADLRSYVTTVAVAPPSAAATDLVVHGFAGSPSAPFVTLHAVRLPAR